MLQSVFYVISYMALLSGIFFLKKSEEKLNAVTWLGLSVMTTLCFQALIAAAFYKTPIPISVITIGAADLIMGITLWIISIKRGLQKLYVKAYDVAALIFTALIAGFYFRQKFQLGNGINFISVDSASHFDIARTIVTEHRSPTNMFFAAVNSAMPMEALIPKTGIFEMYKTFTLWETGYFFLSGLMFYILINHFLDSKGMKVGGFFSIVIYMLAYPLYSYLFGFSYFGLSIALIAYILYMASLFISRDISRVYAYIMLGMGLFGLFLCYMLFVPAIYPGILIAIAIGIICTDRLISGKSILTMLGVFLAPSVAGMLLTFGNLIFLSSGSGSGSGSEGGSSAPSGIALDGGCYNDMYSNFVYMLPFVIAGICIGCMEIKKAYQDKKEKNEKSEKSIVVTKLSMITAESAVLVSVTCVMAVFMAAMAVFTLKGKVSVYYYVRNNNVFFLLASVLLVKTLSYLYTRFKPIVVSYYIVVILCLGMIRLNVDERITEQNERLLRVGADQLFDVYKFNHDFVRFAFPVTVNEVNVYEYMVTNVPSEGEDAPKIIAAGSPTFTSWFKVMTRQPEVVQINDYDTFMATDVSDYDYICIQTSDIFSDQEEMVFDEDTVLLKNNSCKIIKIAPED